jgi:hypothetical protein
MRAKKTHLQQAPPTREGPAQKLIAQAARGHERVQSPRREQSPQRGRMRDRRELIERMSFSCVAYGLRIDSTFELPGVEPSDGEPSDGEDGPLPRLSIDLTDTEALALRWSGGALVWRGVLGDGRELLLARGVDGDHLFEYGDRARFHLDPTQSELSCAPSRNERNRLDWQRALLTKVLPSISVIRGYEALHASVLDSPDGAVAIMGPSGAGKSTLATELLRRGWSLLADDQLTLDRSEDGEIRAHPGTPHMNLEPAPEEPQDSGILRTLALLAGERWATAEAFARRPRPVQLLCMLRREPGLQGSIERLRPNPVALAPHMLGLPPDAERERRRFALFADLLDSTSLVRVTGGSDDSPAQFADLIERAPHELPLAAARGRA